MSSLDIGWGSEAWGQDQWGSGSAAFELATVTPVRENVVRVGFTEPPYFSKLNDQGDASRPDYYTITANPDSTGADGFPARAVRVAEVVLSDFDGAGGFFVDVITDRPLSPYPALYTLDVANILSGLGYEVSSTPIEFFGLFRQLVGPSVDKVIPSRDFANDAALTSKSDPNSPVAVNVDSTGDYAHDEGVDNLKKRLFRRGITRPDAFAHLPGYGVGIPQEAKRLSTVAIRSAKAAEWERQALLEPDVTEASCEAITDPTSPNLTRFLLSVKTRGGKRYKFDIPFENKE